jgi:hypothetical protein
MEGKLVRTLFILWPERMKFLYLAEKSLSYIGLNRQKAGKAFFVSGIGMLLIFIIACGIQLLYLNLAGVKATLALTQLIYILELLVTQSFSYCSYLWVM